MSGLTAVGQSQQAEGGFGFWAPMGGSVAGVALCFLFRDLRRLRLAPATQGDVVQVFATGMGATQPAVATGLPSPSTEPLARVVTPVTATVGGLAAQVQFAGLAPGFVGLYQVNVQIPAGVVPGPAVPVVLLQNGVSSNTVSIALQ